VYYVWENVSFSQKPMNKQLDTLLNQYNAIKTRIEEKTEELHFVRDKIARLLLRNGDYNGATAVRVSATVVREHKRKGFTYIRVR